MRSTVPSTPTKLLPRKASLQHGQAIVLIAVLILVLFGMLGLAIDSGRGYVDRRDQQSAVDASALAAGDWYENYSDLTISINQSVALYQRNLRIYSGIQTSSQITAYVGPTGALRQDTYTYTFAGSYTLTIVATDTQFNGYQFVYTTNHNLPLAFMQIFGGGLTIPISATATSVVGNQRQTPALLTLSTDKCSTNLTGSAQLTVLGDVYSNGTACLDANLHEAGTATRRGSNRSDAQFYCYNDSPGFVPYPPPAQLVTSSARASCRRPRCPTLASWPSVGYYATAQGYNEYNRGT
jgi:Flp pilus assembly protein TadG